MILVIGASGTLGKVLCRQLNEKKFPLRASSRKPEKIKNTFLFGSDIVYADLTRPQSIEDALVGVDTVIVCAHALLGKGSNNSFKVDFLGHRRLIDIAAKKGTR